MCGEGDILALDAVDDDGDWGLRDRLHAGLFVGAKGLVCANYSLGSLSGCVAVRGICFAV